MKNWEKIEQDIKGKGVLGVQDKCYFCGKEVDGMLWCYGCKEFVCEDCENSDPDSPCGEHNVDEHRGD